MRLVKTELAFLKFICYGNFAKQVPDCWNVVDPRTESGWQRTEVDGEASWKPFAPTQGTTGIDDDDDDNFGPKTARERPTCKRDVEEDLERDPREIGGGRTH
jgi:hypothetical protein